MHKWLETLVSLWENNVTVVITADDKHKKSGKVKAWNPQQLDDAEQVAVIEDPSPVNTDESNEELALHPSRSPTGCCKFCSWADGCDRGGAFAI